MTDIPVLQSLDELAPVNLSVIVTLRSGAEITIPMRTLTYFEVFSIDAKVPNPTPPVSAAGKDGPIYNWRDATYLQQIQLAEMERAYRRVLAALRITVPGETEDERVATLKAKLDAGVMRQLNDVLLKSAMGGEARIAARAATFQPAGSASAEGVPGARVDTGSI